MSEKEMDGQRPKIHILDIHTANRIAAGEVVDRPASVVRELVENAIDAGATKIDVRICDSDYTQIRVTDNGCGMSVEDMRLSVLRHATSKIATADDLKAINTLGFRGEALAAIAAVSKLTITSRQTGSDVCYSMTVEGGQAQVPQEAAGRPGTTIMVDRLFYNTPVRKEFLKTIRTEAALVSTVLSDIAIAHPDLAISLRHGNHRAINTLGNNDIRQILISTQGQRIVNAALPLATDGLVVGGMITVPTFCSENPSNLHFYVNGRAVRCRELTNAVMRGYEGWLTRKYPYVFMLLCIPPNLIDVNIHPSKLEIRLRDPRQITERITKMVERTLATDYRILGRDRYKVKPQDRVYMSPPANDDLLTPIEPQTVLDKSEAKERTLRSMKDMQIDMQRGMIYDRPKVMPDLMKTFFNKERLQPEKPSEQSPEKAARPHLTVLVRHEVNFSSLRVLGQHLGTYIVASGGHDIYLIDQHAAAERIIFEQLVEREAAASPDSEMLAVPLQVDLSYADHLLLTDHIMDLRDFGFIIEHFGETTYIIRGVPVWYEASQADELFYAVFDKLKNGVSGNAKLRREDLFMAACKKAVKANRYLSSQDISGLFAALDKCTNAQTCPHGRPIYICLSEQELRKRFLRSGI